MGYRAAVRLSRLLRPRVPGAGVDGVHAPGINVVRDSRDRLARWGHARVHFGGRDWLHLRPPRRACLAAPFPGRQFFGGRTVGSPGEARRRARLRPQSRRRQDGRGLRRLDCAGAGGGRVKVLAISNLYPPDVIGGYELACFQAVEALRARGHEVRVLTSTPREPVASAPDVVRTLQLSDVWNTYLCDYRRSAPATLHRLNVESRFVNAHNVHALTALLEEFQPDVAYVCNLIGVGGLGIMGCLQYLKVPWVWQLGDRVPYYMCCKWERVVPELAREFERFVQGHFIVVSNRLLDEIESFGIRLNGQVDVLPYWIAGKRPPARRGFYRAGSCLRIVSAGQIVQNKGMDLIIEAAARLRDGGCESFMVDLYGKVTDPFFPNLIRKHDLAGHVVLKGARPHAELLPLYRHYDLFAFPTWEREPFGLVPLEAGVAGCVSVITQNCAIAEWLVKGVH